MYEIDFCNIKSVTKITDKLEHRVALSFKEDYIYLEVRYNQGKFTINKTFPNTFDGNEALKKEMKNFDSEKKVKKYFKLEG